MKTPVSRQGGFTLIETLVYLGVYSVLIGVAFLALEQCLVSTTGLHRNADDIVRALHAGEMWRDDVRTAAGPVQIGESGQIVRIPQRHGEVLYKFAEAQVFRKTGRETAWIVLLPKVEQSRMEPDVRQHVTAWRWELELQPARQPANVRPLFTFLSVPGTANPP